MQETKQVIIEHNLTIREISNKLAWQKVIKYPVLFTFIAKIYTLKTPLKSGEYEFTAHISPWQTLQILGQGKSIIHKLIIPEGLTVSDIIDKVKSEPRLLGKLNEEIPEGSLMPSTYFFSYGDKKDKIINWMRRLMSENLDKLLPMSRYFKSSEEILTLASIIELETNIDEEKPIIAAVFLNRLKKGMRLQSCATVIYALTQGKFKLNRPLCKNDLIIASPYNTYYINGLPPTPIACPGIKSLEAVVNPDNSPVLYFVLTTKGNHHFSNNLQEHNKYKRKLTTLHKQSLTD